jgi:oligopeptide transport system permease protein
MAVTDPTMAGAAGSVSGRSLWQDAFRRLRRNRAAMASLVILLALVLIGVFGPMGWPHPHDRVYTQFVRVPASLEAYPRADTIMPAFERELARTRLAHGEPELGGSTVTVSSPPTRPSTRASCASSSAPTFSRTRASTSAPARQPPP